MCVCVGMDWFLFLRAFKDSVTMLALSQGIPSGTGKWAGKNNFGYVLTAAATLSYCSCVWI